VLDERAVGIEQELRIIDRAAIALVDADGDDHASLLGGFGDHAGRVGRYGHRLIEQFVVLRAHLIGRFDEGKIGVVGNDRFREGCELDALAPVPASVSIKKPYDGRFISPAALLALALPPRLPNGHDTAPPGQRCEAATASFAEEARLRSALAVISAENRDIWLKVGAALHVLGARGAWDDWSKTSGKFDAADQDRVWASFHAERKEGVVTIATIYNLAKELGWRPQKAEPFVNGQANGAAKTLPPSRVTGAGTFMRSYAPISYTLGGILPSGYLYGLTAKQGSGKTAWKIAATIAVAMNRPDVIGCDVEPGRVAYVTIENPTDFKMKLAVNCYAHNISYDEIEPRVAIIDGRDTPEQIFEGLKLDAEANGSFQLVCFDTFAAGFAAAGAGAFNDNEAVLNYVIRLRPLTTLPGLPSVLVAFHPTKNAGEGELIPYGGGSTYNEIDGNLTLWKEAQIKLYHNRLRGPEFEPKYFRIEMLSCQDIVDKQGRQILLPVMRHITEIDAAEREKKEGNLDLALLRAMAANPDGTQLEWTFAIGLRSKSAVNARIQRLRRKKLVEEMLTGKWRLTPKGQKEAETART
jgi:hypothetical protein